MAGAALTRRRAGARGERSARKPPQAAVARLAIPPPAPRPVAGSSRRSACRSPSQAPVSGEAVAPDGKRLLVLGGLDAAGRPRAGSSASILGPVAWSRRGASPSRFTTPPPRRWEGPPTCSEAAIILDDGRPGDRRRRHGAGRGPPSGAAIGPRRGHGRRPDLPDRRLRRADASPPPSFELATAEPSRRAARLPIPVRYPAVAAGGGKIYVFGGETANGAATRAIQVIDTDQRQRLGRRPAAQSARARLRDRPRRPDLPPRRNGRGRTQRLRAPLRPLGWPGDRRRTPADPGDECGRHGALAAPATWWAASGPAARRSRP